MKLICQSILIIFLAVTITSCTISSNWEYKVITLPASKIQAPDKNYSKSNDFFKQAISSTTILTNESLLNTLGKDGWELATSYLEMETVYPNLLASGSGVDGLQPNVRPQQLVVILKRPMKKL
jgi:hypothetical protein